MSGFPVFADPSTSVVYHAVPSAPVGGNRHGFVAGGHPQQAPPPTMAMMVVQNNPQQQQQQQQQESTSGIPLPPGMEIVLGDKKYTIQYQSYEMTREKATEYIAKCTGTPYSRMSSPPDPESIAGVTEVRGGGLGASTPFTTVIDRYQQPKPPHAAGAPIGVPSAAMAATAGDRGTTMHASEPPTAMAEDRQQQQQQQHREKSPDEVSVYATVAPPAASGLPPIPRGPLQQSQLPKAPELQSVATDNTSGYMAQAAYAPPPPPIPRGSEAQEQQQNMGYYWEDGVWKVWQANSGTEGAAAEAAPAAAASKMPPPLPVPQHLQPQSPPKPYPAQLPPPDRPQYQYQYQYNYPPQQQQVPPQQHPRPPSIPPAGAIPDLASYALPPSHQQHPHHLRGPPPPPPPGLIPPQGHAGGSNAPAAPGTDAMMHRYI